MTIHGIGVDLLHVPRMAALVRRRGANKIVLRILSPPERSAFSRLWPTNSDEQAAMRFLGVRWAVKEAAYKALYPLRPTWKELTYTSFDPHAGSKPTLAFHPSSSTVPGQRPKLHVSVSHDGEYILAHVIAEHSDVV
ncbi:4'-phosphopantetheinyl transferase [Boletus edulis BED1]|uniref:4'-phosphopantetheinyl transferase n=1 Tax=Boletus edulis BED1 TaxID=1328754 RepID=A0AAD4C6A3_BOLED|nr:4'-phosphopantetheinyl transferase [Boletus edulis BED1]